MRPSRGELWWADLPGDKIRPVLVMTRDPFASRLTSVLVAPVTTRIRSIPTEVSLGPDDGIPVDSVANFDDLRSLNIIRLRKRIGRLSSAKMAEACRALRFAAAC
jgi:mRNA interferase MazF